MSGYKTNSINDFGGNLILLIELDSDYEIPTSLTDGTNCFNLGYIKESTKSLDPSITEHKHEGGKLAVAELELSGGTKGILMQSDDALLDFLAYGVAGKKYLEIKYNGIADGKHREFWAIGEVMQKMNLKTPGAASSLEYEFKATPAPVAVTFDIAAVAAIAAEFPDLLFNEAAVTIPANQEHKLVATSVGT